MRKFETVPPTLVLTVALASALVLASCRQETQASEAPETTLSSIPKKQISLAQELELDDAIFASHAPLRLRSLLYRQKSDRVATLLSLEITDQDRFAIQVHETAEQRIKKNDPRELSPPIQVEKQVLYGLRGLLKLSETHRRTVGDTVEDHWRTRVSRIVKAEGELFPIDFADRVHLVFDSEMENLITGTVVEMTNDYELTVVEVLEANEYLAKMPSESLSERIHNRVFVVELRWTFGPRDERQVTENQTLFYSTDLGFTVPCCDSENVHHQIDEVSTLSES